MEFRSLLILRTTFLDVTAAVKALGINLLKEKRRWARKARLQEKTVSEGWFSIVLSFKSGMLSALRVSGWHGLKCRIQSLDEFLSGNRDVFHTRK